MDELYAFLFAGLFILLMLCVFFGVSWNVPHTHNQNMSVEKLNWKIIEFGNIALKEQKLEKKEVLENNFGIKNGIFFGKVSYKRKFEIEDYILKNLKNATLSFSVKATNNYGDLYIVLNNETIFKNRALLGDYRLNIDPRRENVVEFGTSSSGWKIWAPSVYNISNLSIEMDYSFKEINITLNNQTEYSGMPETRVKVVPLKNIKEGKNLISFSSTGEMKLENVKLRLFYY